VISVALARRYARALLQLAQRQENLPRTQDELRGLAVLFHRDPRIRRFFESPGIARAEKVKFLETTLKPRLGEPVYGLLHVLLRRHRLDHLPAIADELTKQAEEVQGIVRATIRTAIAITDGQVDAVTKALGRKTGKQVLLAREVDASVLGGALVSLDHHVIDGTLATELWRIRRQLREARVHGRG
jgi:F-type H+-transporting ATPase subunit delta